MTKVEEGNSLNKGKNTHFFKAALIRFLLHI